MKSAKIEEFLERLTRKHFGHSRQEMVCVSCGSRAVSALDFRDDLSRKEFTLSRFCQECQDETFGK